METILPECHSAVGQSIRLLDILLGICEATGLPKETAERFGSISSPALPETSSSYSPSISAAEENITIDDGAKNWFSAWNEVLAPLSSEIDAEMRHILNLGLVVCFLRESNRQLRPIDGKHLTILWDNVHDALTSEELAKHSLRFDYTTQGFFKIPICDLAGQNGDDNESYDIHVWRPESRRDKDFEIHSSKALIYNWVLAGDLEHHTFKVESTESLQQATHAEFNWVRQASVGKRAVAYLANRGELVQAAMVHSTVRTLDTSHRIEPGTWHSMNVAEGSLHACFFLLKSRAAKSYDDRIIGPISVERRDRPPHPTDVTSASLASEINAIRLWNKAFDSGKWHARRSEMEGALRIFHRALYLCETIPDFPNAPHYVRIVHGELGFTNRCLGRYDLARAHLEEALKETGLTHHRIKANGELGTVLRAQGHLVEARHALQTQYDIAKDLGDHRVACRAIGNIGMTNYQLYQQNRDDALLELAIEQLKERVSRARHIKQALDAAKMDERKRFSRKKHASVWESIGLNRLSLCYTAQGNAEEAIKMAKESQSIVIEPKDSTVNAISLFFYGRALLRGGQQEEAMKHLNPSVLCTPAIALCKEPSEENRQYLQELVDVGVDMDRIDEYGYTGLDYTVFGADVKMEKIVIQGLRNTLKDNVDAEITKRQYEARLRKAYRELFHDKMRPELLKGGEKTLKNLRAVYAAAIEARRQEHATQQFDQLKCVRYSDFLRCGRLPRSDDGFAKDLSLDMNVTQESGVDFMIFFSYRWINQQKGNQSSPDDADDTQYHRMVHATEDFLKLDPSVNPDRLGIWLVRRNLLLRNLDLHILQDYACIDQDNPTSGVTALPMLLAQCNAVISIVDHDDYYTRAWCALEIVMIQTLQKSYQKHKWYEYAPSSTSSDQGGREMWTLRPGPLELKITAADKNLTVEDDRAKIVFLERQTQLLK
jgi:tetratricopeptide (TPR) repeat protein